MIEEESIFDIPRERLDLIDHDVYKWICCAEGCDCGTHVRDYGLMPYLYHPRKSIGWFNTIEGWWYCGKHWPMERKGLPIKMKELYLAKDNLAFIKSVTVTNLKLHE